MTLLTVIQSVCPVVGVLVPQTVFANIAANRTMQEMVALANEAAQTIAWDTREWTALKTTTTFVGDGINEAFNLPANYRRMLLKSNVWRSTQTQWPMRFVPDADEWLQRRASTYYDSSGEWTIYGGQMHIQPIMAAPVTKPAPLPPLPPAWAVATDYIVSQVVSDPVDSTVWTVAVAHTSAATGTFADDRLANPTYWTATILPVPPPIVISPAQTATFNYLDKNCIKLASGGYGDRFMADGDSFRLDERLLKLAMIWRWKSQKGTAYAEDMSTYGDALNALSGADQPAPIIIGRVPMMRGVSLAYPWPVPTNGP
jgi:hypothetical protein